MRFWYLYLLECEGGSIYTGIAVDVESRFAAHQPGMGARYTRSHPPQRILLSIKFPDRSSASKAEFAVKKLSSGEKRKLIESSAFSMLQDSNTECKVREFSEPAISTLIANNMISRAFFYCPQNLWISLWIE